MNKCLKCGAPVRRLTDAKNRASGAAWMIVNDPLGLFCRLRCAALYGIQVAQRVAIKRQLGD